MSATPNILYLHSHDTGRYIQPYGHQVPTPNIQRLADQGMLFRDAFCAAPSCSGSRACLLTGQWAHNNGMTGLAHRGWTLGDYDHHLVHTLRAAGYWSALIGEQHVSIDPGILGYDHVVDIDTTHVEAVAPAAVALLRERPPQPFFMSVGFFETHREYFNPTSIRDALYSLPPANLPDTPETRRDMASYKASARSLDQGVGAVLNALDEHDLADDTLVILTTDHGLAFPGAKATLTDRGIGVLLIMRGPGGFHGGRVSEALVSQIDLFPTICELIGASRPDWLQGRSLLPLMRREADEVNAAIFAELTYHAAYEPQRAIRTRRWKYIRRFGERELPVLANVDDGPTKDLFIANGWAERPLPREALYDLLFDPAEANNLAGDRMHDGDLAELRERLEAWMRETDDPLLHGAVDPPPGAHVNDPDDRSAGEPAGGAALSVLHPDIQPLLDDMNAAPGPPAHEVPVEEARAAHVAETERLCGPGEPVADVRDERVPSPGGDVLVRLYRPEGEGPLPVVAYLHGGGWVMGDVSSYDALLRALANESGAVVAGVEYRRAPEHRFPAALDDSLAAIRWLAGRADDVDGSRLAVAGDSAGGNLAAVAARRLRGEVPLRMQALVYPVCDAGLNTPSYREFESRFGLSAASMRRFWNLYLDGADGSHPDASPLRAADLAGVAPAFVLIAEVDVLRDEGEAYAAALRDAGVPCELERWPGTIHGFFRWLAATTVAREAVARVGAELRRALA